MKINVIVVILISKKSKGGFMKIRSGFVSNSSSSSFVVYGAVIDFDAEKFLNILKGIDEAKYNKVMNDFKAECIDNGIDEPDNDDIFEYAFEDRYGLVDILLECMGADNFNVNIYDGNMSIGREYNTIGDDETGKQFKDSVLSTLKVFGVTECEHIDEVVQC